MGLPFASMARAAGDFPREYGTDLALARTSVSNRSNPERTAVPEPERPRATLHARRPPGCPWSCRTPILVAHHRSGIQCCRSHGNEVAQFVQRFS